MDGLITVFTRIISLLQSFGSLFLEGAGITLLLSLVTVIFGTIMGLLLLLLRKSSFKPFKWIGSFYVEFVRGIPLLLLLYLIVYFVFPKISTPISVAIALILNSGAYVSELIRAGIEAVDKGQYEACRSLGLSKFQTMKKVVLPQAVKKILPALGNEFVMLIKETSLASIFFVGDLMTIKNSITSITYLTLEPFIIVGAIYFILTFFTTKLIKRLEAKMEA